MSSITPGLLLGGIMGLALLLAFLPMPGWLVLPLMALMGFGVGIAGPSRDLLVKRSTPPNATGRVYGIVYSGLDIGQALSPLLFGRLMDHHQYQGVWLGLVLLQVLLGTGLAFYLGKPLIQPQAPQIRA